MGCVCVHEGVADLFCVKSHFAASYLPMAKHLFLLNIDGGGGGEGQRLHICLEKFLHVA